MKIKIIIIVYIINFSLPQKINSLYACGMSLHIYMSQKAIDNLPDNDLKKLLLEEKRALYNGSWYPDSGFLIANEHGHFNHTETFINSYFKYVGKNCSLPFDKDCRKLFSHFMGVLAHYIEDFNFDRYFLTQVAKYDFKNNIDKAQKHTDTGLDMLVLSDKSRWKEIAEPYTPVKHLCNIYDSINKEYKCSDVKSSSDKFWWIHYAERFAFIFSTLYYKMSMPWGK